ncbi:uncharacterized protein [Oryza sativa Japonica Group]|uniref:Uncharacterized protein n=3 Tax=Oryza sativa subsp. japonica TaxID=39947 RepID=A3BI43_ORYSJ|nr:uncharacterized protein LOC4342801 [Oryza sativa Japonica Group]EAZ39232.1 hypothetical protein OsJ_23655 [Oryza sativa Japonica Group]KAF2922085.1 hypothetical protein DAI22_07g084500 [Oryza sativa Japonica Group]
MAPGSAKDRDGHTTEPVLGRGDYEAAHQKPSAAAAANAPSRPPPPPRVAKSLPREQPGGRGSGRGAEGSASASPVAVGDREGKKTSTATQGGGHASSSPRRLGEKLARDHPGGGGRGAEGLASAAFPVVDRKGKRKVCAASEGAASSSSPPFERLSGEELGAGAGGRGTEASTSASAAAVVDQDEREVREWPRFALLSNSHLLEIGARCEGHKDLSADAQESTYTVVSSVVRNFSADFSWWSIMGNPMKQTIPNTCTILACAVCIEALHRLEWERLHGPGTFLCRAAAPRKLRRACIRDDILHPEEGVESKKMVLLLKKIKGMGGIRTTNAPPPAPFLLPLKSWRMYRQKGSLTRERAVHLLRTGGPYIGIIRVSLLYHFIDASVNDELVYRWVPPELRTAADVWLIDALVAGRATDNDICDLISETNGNHVIVCYGYRHRGGELQILILDNHAQTGPSRWIGFEELEKVCVLRVDPLPLDLDQLNPLPVYPISGC